MIKKQDRDGLHRRPSNAEGIWYFYYRASDGRWREKSTGTRNYSQARQVRTSQLQKIQSGLAFCEISDWLLRDAAQLWLQRKKTTVQPATFSFYACLMQPLIRMFGGRKLREISPAMVRGYQADRAAVVSAQTVNREVQILASILDDARIMVLSEVRPLKRVSKSPGRALSAEEERRLFQTAASKPAWTPVLWVAILAANTGLRGGEIKRLRVGDILLSKQSVVIHRNATKTDAGERLVPLNPAALSAVRQLLKRAAALGAKSPEHFLLPADKSKLTKGQANRPVGYDVTEHQLSWRTAWRNLTEAAKLKGLRFHDLRHHFITRLAEANVPIQVAMSLVGHIQKPNQIASFRFLPRLNRSEANLRSWKAKRCCTAARTLLRRYHWAFAP